MNSPTNDVAVSRVTLRRFVAWFRGSHLAVAAGVIAAAGVGGRLLSWPARLLLDRTIPPWGMPPLQGVGARELFALAVVVAPVVETLLFQTLLFRLAGRLPFLEHRPLLIIALSAVLFGLAHDYGVGYMLSAMGVGWVLAAAFWILGRGRRAFWAVALAHALMNACAFVANTWGSSA